MEKIKEKFRDKNIVMTPQRIAVWKVIDGNRNHPCVEFVYAEVKKHFPSISVATVYSILETFKTAGLVNELFIRKNKICFDPFTESHHHFLCKTCEKVYDIGVKCSLTDKKGVDGHTIEAIHGYFYGVCKDCLKDK